MFYSLSVAHKSVEAEYREKLITLKLITLLAVDDVRSTRAVGNQLCLGHRLFEKQHQKVWELIFTEARSFDFYCNYNKKL